MTGEILSEKQNEVVLEGYSTGAYWENRMDMMYYRYVDYILRIVGKDAQSLIDIGTANCPYLEWFDWIPQRISFDQAPPYSSKNVIGMQGDFLTHDFGRRFDLCTCLQVLEHIPDAQTFARRLLEIADTVVVSVPYKWGAGAVKGHVQDPVDRQKLRRWFGRKPNYSVIVNEPFLDPQRLVAVYHRDPTKWFTKAEMRMRVKRHGLGKTQA